MTILLNKPIQPDLKILTKYLESVNSSGWYTNFGPLHEEFTCRLEEYLGVENLLLVSNGTLALQVAYKALNIRTAITTPFSFVATASSLIWEGVETSFSDICAKSYNLSPNKLKNIFTNNKNLDAIVATHVYGNPCNVNSFSALSEQHNIKIVYDAAHAFGVKIGDESVLNFGDASTLSFHATKVFHTVEGGCIVFKSKSDFERAKRLINFGIDDRGIITEAGVNAKLNEYQCAVGLTLLEYIDSVISHRAELFRLYRQGLRDILENPEWHDEASYNGSYMPINIGEPCLVEKFEKYLLENGVQCRRYFKPSLDKVFSEQQNYGSDNSNRLAQTIICLPLHYYMSRKDVATVVELVKRFFK